MDLKIKLCKVTSANTDRTMKEWPIKIEFYKNGRPKILIGVPSEGNFKQVIKDEIDDTRQTNS